jgi:hypothetical protein
MNLNSLYTSKDGAKKFQMTITYKKGTVLNGKKNPTIYMLMVDRTSALTQYSQCRLLIENMVFTLLRIYVAVVNMVKNGMMQEHK